MLFVLAAAAPAPAGQTLYTPGPVLGDDGLPATQGWAPREALRFDASKAVNPKHVRRWDYFAIMDSDAVIELTLADIGFAKFCSVGVMNFRTGKATMGFMTALNAARDKLILSETSHGTSVCKMGGDLIVFQTFADHRVLTVDIKGGLFSAAVKGRLVLHERAGNEYLSLLMPFEEGGGSFFYENKIPGVPAEGTVFFDGQPVTFDAKRAFAVMDWGRGVWPMHTTWYWGGGGGYVDGVPVGFNLGYGFGVTTAATENLVVVDGKAHKFARIDWTVHPTEAWTFVSDDGRFNLKFLPIQHQTMAVDALFKAGSLDKAYGFYEGTITLEDGRVLTIDKFFGWAEEVMIKW